MSSTRKHYLARIREKWQPVFLVAYNEQTGTELRTGHAPLNHHLARIGKAPSPACPNCDAAFETVHHFLFMCPAYEVPRRNLRVKVGPHKMDFKGLLAEMNNTRHLLRFLEKTKRLAPTFGNLNPPERRQ